MVLTKVCQVGFLMPNYEDIRQLGYIICDTMTFEFIVLEGLEQLSQAYQQSS